MTRFEPGTSRMQGLDYSLYANILDLCHMSLGMAFYHPGLCPFDNTEFGFKLRAATRWRSHVPPMMDHWKMVTVGWGGPAAYRGIRTAVAVSNPHTQGSFGCQKRKKGEGMQKIPQWVCLVLNTTSNVYNASVLPLHTTDFQLWSLLVLQVFLLNKT